ncbi:glycerophosphocholine cholinephosphodiesterase ENPP6-like [Haliotis rubra]|uniref:glycerophosphocholine cholinephosphodiesterase ENPP6-like n=1 Tax=Haliotis rubra TaxID=36100 RepID=UPI001EE5B38E|nr:glycerophosphocholine cholinephosphodiesterase ENPP6-like [Haliotis rubra]
MLSVQIAAILILLTVWTAADDFKNKLLLVSMDGFRWDYLNNASSTPHFHMFGDGGVRATYMNASFPTLTFPNHYTIVTGLWEESHGIVGNYMYDPVFNASFNLGTKETRWWNGGEPLWVTAKKQGLKAGTYFWPGSEAEIQGVRPDYWYPYTDNTPYKERIDTVVDWFKNQNIQLATLYYPEPDKTGHSFGPESQEVRDKVMYMDEILGYLVQKMKENDLENEVNVIVTSDHGMVEVDNINKVVDITDYVDMTKVDRVPIYGPMMHILPVEGQDDAIIQSLAGVEHITVYKKEDVPERLHYQDNRRIMPIIIIADEGWQLTTNKTRKAKSTLKATHGYDNALMSMKPIFLARGPNFKANLTSDPIQNVDIYPLVCKLLNIKPAPNNGSLARVNAFIQDTPPVSGSPSNAPVLLFECLFVFTIFAYLIL